MEKGKEQGGMGKITLSSSSPRWKTGGRRAGGSLGRRPWGLIGAWEVGERESESRWVVPLLNLDGGGSRRVAHGGGRRRPWWQRCKAWRRPGVGGKGEGDQEGSIPYLGFGWSVAR